ncbi:MAG: hypothetical protein V3W41_11565 [Planctomycetota bacterium]
MEITEEMLRHPEWPHELSNSEQVDRSCWASATKPYLSQFSIDVVLGAFDVAFFSEADGFGFGHRLFFGDALV